MKILTDNEIARLIAERDLLLFAIAPTDYSKIEAKLVAISETADAVPLTDAMSPAIRNALWRFNAALTIRKLREALTKIADWQLPTVLDKQGMPQSYEWAHGCLGAQRYIRNIAKEALTDTTT